MNKFKKLLLASSILVATGAANAGYTLNTSDTDGISFGGYIKVDARHVSGDVAYRDFFLGAGTSANAGESKSQTNLNANESRFNMKYTHGEVMGFIEMDFINSAQGNEVISNSVAPRLRHAFIKYQNWTVGQTWSTFMNTSALAETLDFAGPAMGEVFVRHTQVRYTNGGLQLSLENPESYKGDPSEDSVPDFVARYNFKGDWGSASVAGLARQLNSAGGDSESALGYSVAARIKTGGKDDLRIQYSGGEVGRYVGVVAATDFAIVDGVQTNEVEKTDAYLVAYRHFWTEDTRSTLAYGHAEADLSGMESSQWSINVIKNLTKQLSIGAEVGNNSRDDLDIDSNYAQVSLKYVL